jgi:hypothetical protein
MGAIKIQITSGQKTLITDSGFQNKRNFVWLPKDAKLLRQIAIKKWKNNRLSFH